MSTYAETLHPRSEFDRPSNVIQGEFGHLERRSRQGEVAHIVRRHILSGDVAPGDRLSEARVSSWVDATRSVLRGAFAALAAEGLVELQMNHGARVHCAPIREAIEYAEVLRPIERMTGALAATRRDDESSAAIRARGAAVREASIGASPLDYENAVDHYGAISEAANHAAVRQTLVALRARNSIRRYQLSRTVISPIDSVPLHLAVSAAICNGDAGAADEALRAQNRLLVKGLCELQRRRRPHLA
ncbi:GntR family transcriptional regulator [Microbacterium sp.]|uniref:GntR family transcriptional regulator n=1 Tax=Microbacterium sp. TaxID=51671 RepID=UPI003A88B399